MKTAERIIQSRRLWWVATALWAAVIFAGSSISGTGVPSGIAPYAHFAEYAILGAFLSLALSASGSRSSTAAILTATALASVYGITDEIHQAFVPLRTPDALDWLVDTLGAFVGALLAASIARQFIARRQPG